MWENLEPLKALPPIRRFRNDRWYDDKGRHWVDLWKQSGDWLFGHARKGAMLAWKNLLDKGLSIAAPSRGRQHLERALRSLFPNMVDFFAFRNAERALSFLQKASDRFIGYAQWSSLTWRPFDENLKTENSLPWIWPILPCGPSQMRIVISTQSRCFEEPADLIPATDWSAWTRAAYDVLPSPWLERVMVSWRQVWIDFDKTQIDRKEYGPLFVRRGPYLFAQVEPEEYDPLFRHFSEAGFVLSPDLSQPSILPQSFSAGELSRFRKAEANFQSTEVPWTSS